MFFCLIPSESLTYLHIRCLLKQNFKKNNKHMVGSDYTYTYNFVDFDFPYLTNINKYVQVESLKFTTELFSILIKTRINRVDKYTANVSITLTTCLILILRWNHKMYN